MEAKTGNGNDASVIRRADIGSPQPMESPPEENIVTEEDLITAFIESDIKAIQRFQAAGFDFSILPKRAIPQGVLGDESRGEEPTHFLDDFDAPEDREQWHALQHAAHLRTRTSQERDAQAGIVNGILDSEVDLCAVYQQRMAEWPFPAFPDVKADTAGEMQAFYHFEFRSVLHGLLEDGARVDSIFRKPGLRLDTECRDPNGRTLFLSACRSSIGADAAVDSVISDVTLAQSSPLHPLATSASRPSLFTFFLGLGVDLLAVDHSGKTALHHLLESKDPTTYDNRSTAIRHSLRYVLNHCPTLINRADGQGNAPIHKALQRLRQHPFRWHWPHENEGLDTVVEDVLAAGADPTARDSRGNTCVHYVMSDGLSEPGLGAHMRSLLRYFLDHGVDINARNAAGRSAVEMFLGDDCSMADRRQAENCHLPGYNDPGSMSHVDDDLFEWFDQAGLQWTQTNAQGRTLLHTLAANVESAGGIGRSELLILKGLDPKSRDFDGETAADIALACGNRTVYSYLTRVTHSNT